MKQKDNIKQYGSLFEYIKAIVNGFIDLPKEEKEETPEEE